MVYSNTKQEQDLIKVVAELLKNNCIADEIIRLYGKFGRNGYEDSFFVGKMEQLDDLVRFAGLDNDFVASQIEANAFNPLDKYIILRNYDEDKMCCSCVDDVAFMNEMQSLGLFDEIAEKMVHKDYELEEFNDIYAVKNYIKPLLKVRCD